MRLPDSNDENYNNDNGKHELSKVWELEAITFYLENRDLWYSATIMVTEYYK